MTKSCTGTDLAIHVAPAHLNLQNSYLLNNLLEYFFNNLHFLLF